MKPLYISYYTIGNGYEVEAEGLIKSLETYQLPHHVVGVRPESFMHNSPTGWVWKQATQYKAEFILGALREFPGRPLVWIDADARFIARPRMFDWLDCDLAAHWYRGKEMVSGTLYLAPRSASIDLVTKWVKRNAEKPGGQRGEQRNLQHLIERTRGLKIVNLPPEYAWIDAGSGNDLSARFYGPRAAVIRHGQASRRLKRSPPPPQISVREALKEPRVGIPAGFADFDLPRR